MTDVQTDGRRLRKATAPISFRRTLLPLLIAPAGIVLATAAGFLWDPGGVDAIRIAFTLAGGAIIGWIAEVLLVIPVLAIAPQWRVPPLAAATAYGAAIALMPLVWTWVVSGHADRLEAIIFSIFAGASWGGTYAIAIRMLNRSEIDGDN